MYYLSCLRVCPAIVYKMISIVLEWNSQTPTVVPVFIPLVHEGWAKKVSVSGTNTKVWDNLWGSLFEKTEENPF
jgi:hypothetical protein